MWFMVGVALGVIAYGLLGLVTSRWADSPAPQGRTGAAGLRAGVGLSDGAPAAGPVRRRVSIDPHAGSRERPR